MRKITVSELRDQANNFFRNVSLGKFGAFQTSQIIGRPYHTTFEILDKPASDGHGLRAISAAELHAEFLIAESINAGDANDSGNSESTTDSASALTGELEEVMRTNQFTVDTTDSQKLSYQDIEELKKNVGGSGKEIIAKLLESHTALDQKTVFSLAKYTLRKQQKYLKRFTVIPVDVPTLTNYLLHEKETAKTMELRDEALALAGCWANVHASGLDGIQDAAGQFRGRWLVVDETGGLLTAAMAERMGTLYPEEEEDDDEEEEVQEEAEQANPDIKPDNEALKIEEQPTEQPPQATTEAKPRQHRNRKPIAMSANSNTLTVIHPQSQPNLSLLKYFSYDATDSDHTHPLHTHLKTLTWLQLLDPNSDSTYTEPEVLPDSILATSKPSKRSNYFRKRRRWERVKSVVDEVRGGGYDGLIVASPMNAVSILRHTVPLLSGGAQVVVYSPGIEPITELADAYSTARRAAYLNLTPAEIESVSAAWSSPASSTEHQDFPLDPTLLLAPMVQTARARQSQVLPGRTHPMMTGRGGAEGYLFHATRVLPVMGERVSARGVGGGKRRKIADGSENVTVKAEAS